MPIIQLPDGSKKNYDMAVTPATIASDIGPGLAKAAMAAKVDGVSCRLWRLLSSPPEALAMDLGA
mgnify:CR=1 FL=1